MGCIHNVAPSAKGVDSIIRTLNNYITWDSIYTKQIQSALNPLSYYRKNGTQKGDKIVATVRY